MHEKERNKRLKALKAKIDSLPERITDTRILAKLAKEYRQLTIDQRKGGISHCGKLVFIAKGNDEHNN